MIPSIDVPKQASTKSQSGNNDYTINNDKTTKEEVEREKYEANHSESVNSLENENEQQDHLHSRKCSAAFLNELMEFPSLVEKSVIIHRDEYGFGLRVKGQAPAFVEHVHENGAAWHAGVRKFDQISKVNGLPVSEMDHKDVVLMFKSCTRFVGLTLLSSIAGCFMEQVAPGEQQLNQNHIKLSPSCFINMPAAPMKAAESNKRSLIKSIPLHNLASSQPSQVGFMMDPNSKDILLESRLNVNHKLMLTKQHSSSHSCNLLIQNLNSSNDSSRDVLPLLMKGKTSSNTFPSPFSSNKLIINQQQQLLQARRSESVSIKPSYLTNNQVTRVERRTSESELSDTNLTICIDCNSSLKIEANRKCCMETVSGKVGHLARQTSSGQLMSGQYHQSELYRQSLFNSSRYSQANQKIDIKVTSTSANNSNRNINIVDTPLQSHSEQANLSSPNDLQQNTFYKLGQSPSTNSLPANESTSNLSGSFNAKTKQQLGQVNKRLEIIKEFIDTERTHTDRLRYLDELFYRPIKNGTFMTSEQLRMVFSCHRTLYKIHKQIYRTLLSANYNLYSEPMIGSALLEIFESDLKRRLEKAACTFCVAQSTNAELLNKLTRRDTKVGEFIAQVTSQQMVGRLGIKDLLASCFQRLTKYPLLLENLLAATPQPESVKAALSNKKCSKSNPQIEDGLLSLSKEDKEREEINDEDEPTEVKNSRRMLAISLAEEREFIERALYQSRQILIKVNESVKQAMSHNKLKEIWKRTDKYPGVPLIDITKQQVVHEGLLTLRLSKRSFDVYVLLLSDYIIILTREGQDKYRLKFFTPDGKSSSSSANSQTVYSPVFVIDEHLTTRDAATDENGFYLLCKRKDDSRIYEFASRSPAERLKWRDRIQWTIERQMIKTNRRPSSESTFTKSSSEISSKHELDESLVTGAGKDLRVPQIQPQPVIKEAEKANNDIDNNNARRNSSDNGSTSQQRSDSAKVGGTISYVEDDGIVMPSKLESSQVLVDQAIQVNIFDILKKPVPIKLREIK